MAQPGRKIDRLHTIFIVSPTEGGTCRAGDRLTVWEASLKSPIRRQHRNLVSAARQLRGQSPNFYRRPTELQKQSVALRYIQDSPNSPRIFFSDFAKTPNLNSRLTRSRPRAPISRPNAGSERSV